MDRILSGRAWPREFSPDRYGYNKEAERLNIIKRTTTKETDTIGAEENTAGGGAQSDIINR